MLSFSSRLPSDLSRFEREYKVSIIAVLGEPMLVHAKAVIERARATRTALPEVKLPVCKSLPQCLVELANEKALAQFSRNGEKLRQLERQKLYLQYSIAALQEISQRTIATANEHGGEAAYPSLWGLFEDFTNNIPARPVNRLSFAPGVTLQKILEDLLKNPADSNYQPLVKKIIYHYLNDALLPTLAEYIRYKNETQPWRRGIRDVFGFRGGRYRLRTFCERVRDRLRPSMEPLELTQLLNNSLPRPVSSSVARPLSIRAPATPQLERTLSVRLPASGGAMPSLSPATSPSIRAVVNPAFGQGVSSPRNFGEWQENRLRPAGLPSSHPTPQR